MQHDRQARRLRRQLRELRLRADQAHGKELDRIVDELEEARLGVRLHESVGGHWA